ncbi:MAG: hypothetical protein CL878_09765 [Dehalococcoidia bacterium]|nr:hypothetical protein [Dehalococcoidia bacterium]
MFQENTIPPTVLGDNASPSRPRTGDELTDAVGQPSSTASKFRLLVDDEFQQAFFDHLDRAKRRIYVQCMTFEGDAAGWAVAGKLLQAKARGVDVRVVVDCFTDYYVSDTYHTHPRVAEEVQRTKAMLALFQRHGIRLVRTRPFGPAHLFVLCRNHKKVMVIDDSTYLGGVNISDHNFAWHDFMVRFDDPALTAVTVEDFHNTCAGITVSLRSGPFVTNRHLRAAYDRLLASAEQEIIISSPYVADLSLVRALAAVRPDVKVKLLTLRSNNLGVVGLIAKYTHRRLRSAGVEISFYRRFSHAKFLIVDRKRALFGSSNFGLDSFLCKDEVGIATDDPLLVAALYQRLYRAQAPNLVPYDAQPNWRVCMGSCLASYAALLLLPLYAVLARSWGHVLQQ